VIAQKPENADAVTKLGNSLMDQWRYDEAEDVYRNGLQHNPDNPIMHYNLSLILKKQGRYQQAEEEARNALTLDPSYNKAQKLISSLQKKSFIDRHLDPIIYPVFDSIDKSVSSLKNKRKNLVKSLQDDYKSIMEQASSAEFHGVLAKGSSGEEAKIQSNKVFDTKGQNIGTLINPMVVDARQFDQLEDIPEELINNLDWKKLEIRESRAQTKVDQKNKELANLQEMRSSSEITPVKKAMVLVVIAKKKKELIYAEHNKNLVKDEKRKLRKRYKLGEIKEVESDDSAKTGTDDKKK
jgi:tetratricopeptide (TPR) repeat protein